MAGVGPDRTLAGSPSTALSQENRQALAADLKEFYKDNRESRFDLESFFGGEPLRQIVEAGQRGSLRFLQRENLLNESYAGQETDIVTLRYAWILPKKTHSKTLVFPADHCRKADRGGTEAHWELRGVQLPK